MNKQLHIQQISGIVAALACIAAISGCHASSSQAKSDPNNQVAPCVADKSCPGYSNTVAGLPAPPPPPMPAPVTARAQQ